MKPSHAIVNGITVDTHPEPIDPLTDLFTRLNTITTGYVGIAIIVASLLLPHLLPAIDDAIARLGLSPWFTQFLVTIAGGFVALLGRWRTFLASQPASTVAADARLPSPLRDVPTPSLPALPARSAPAMSLVQDLGILEVAAGDLIAFASGQPVTQKIDGYTATVVVLPSGPVAPYQALSGSFLSILEVGIEEGVAFSAGAPISIAEKLGNTWYGLSLSKAVAPAPAAAPAA